MYFSVYTFKKKFRYINISLVLSEGAQRYTWHPCNVSEMSQDLGWAYTYASQLRASLCSWHIFAWASNLLPIFLYFNTKAMGSTVGTDPELWDPQSCVPMTTRPQTRFYPEHPLFECYWMTLTNGPFCLAFALTLPLPLLSIPSLLQIMHNIEPEILFSKISVPNEWLQFPIHTCTTTWD